jgi:hypothetical protein
VSQIKWLNRVSKATLSALPPFGDESRMTGVGTKVPCGAVFGMSEETPGTDIAVGLTATTMDGLRS